MYVPITHHASRIIIGYILRPLSATHAALKAATPFLLLSHRRRRRRRRSEKQPENWKMGSVSCESESWVSSYASSTREDPEMETPASLPRIFGGEEQERLGLGMRSNSLGKMTMKKKKKNQVLLEGYVEAPDEDLTRTKSLTDEDLDELKGCLDLGFGFSYDEIPELCNTLPALELCYSMSQKFMDEHQKSPENSPEASLSRADSCSSLSSSMANWKISSPGDHPEDVKARLKFWAQAVACTVRLCS